MASLCVGDLAPDVTEVMLFQKFSTAGRVLSIRICRDMVTGRSLGYAYVSFQQPADAERALDTMNFDPIKGRPCRVMWPQRDPSLKKSGVSNIFIKNLDKAIDNKALYDTFSAFGSILTCKVVTDKHGNSKGYGFVCFETNEAADMAIEKVDGMLLNDKKVFVGKFVSRNRREKQLGTSQRFTNIYIKNFGEDFNETQLKELFNPFGNIISQRVMLDEEGRAQGFGFVSFDLPQSAARAVDELNGKMMPNGKRLYCNRAQKKSERLSYLRRKFDAMKMERISRYQDVNLYVKNLDDEIDDECLRTEFSKFGSITSAKVMTHDNGESKGFGFVCFTSPEEATKAISEMNGHIIVAKRLFVALAQHKEERRAQLAAQHMQQRSSGMRGIPTNQMNPAMVQTKYFPMQKQNQRAFSPPTMTQMRPWQPSINRPYNVQMQQQRERRNVPRSSISSSNISRRSSNPSGNQQPVGAQQQRNITQSQAAVKQQQQAKLKFNVNARNQPETLPAGRKVVVGENKGKQLQITTSDLSQATPQQQKQLLGEQLFYLISQIHPYQTGKITGMLLEMENSEILHMLDSPESLKVKVDEAVTLLRVHQEKHQLH